MSKRERSPPINPYCNFWFEKGQRSNSVSKMTNFHPTIKIHLGDTGDRTRGLSHAKRTRYHCATTPLVMHELKIFVEKLTALFTVQEWAVRACMEFCDCWTRVRVPWLNSLKFSLQPRKLSCMQLITQLFSERMLKEKEKKRPRIENKNAVGIKEKEK